MITHAQRHGYEDDSQKEQDRPQELIDAEADSEHFVNEMNSSLGDDSVSIPLNPVPPGVKEIERTVLVKPETLEAIYRMEGKPEGIPVLMDGNGNYFPVPPKGWTP